MTEEYDNFWVSENGTQYNIKEQEDGSLWIYEKVESEYVLLLVYPREIVDDYDGK